MIDAGPKNALLEYLSELGVSHIDQMVISHADQDHLGALAQLVATDKFTIGHIALNSDATKESIIWEDLRYELDQAAWRGDLRFDVALVPNQEPLFDGGTVRMFILGPSRFLASGGPGSKDRYGRKISTNSISAVVGLKLNDLPLVLLPGDIDDVGLDDLLEHGEPLNYRLLVFPHHGGKPGSADIDQFVDKICQAVSPEVIVFSIGRGLHGTPNRDVVAACRNSLPSTRIMCTQVSEHCAETLPVTDANVMNSVFCGGRERRQCCAGTILIDINQDGIVYPSEQRHRAFIQESVTHPLCMD